MRERTKCFIIGLAAGSVALALSFFLRIFAGGLFIPELAAQTLFSLTPGAVESQAVGTLGSLAKYSAFAGAIAINLFLYGVLGVLLHRTYRKLFQKGYLVNVLQLVLLSYFVLFVLAIILLEVTEIVTQPLPIQLISLYLLPPHIAFGFILYEMFQRHLARPQLIEQKSSPQETGVDIKRRLFLRTAVAGAIVSVVLFYGLDLLFSKPEEPPNVMTNRTKSLDGRVTEPTKSSSIIPDIFAEPGLASFVASEVTPNDRFYKIDINVVTPVVDMNTWKLTVNGLVNNPLELTYEEMKSISAVEEYATLECISNKVGEDLISTALWKGVTMKSILEKAQVRPEATYIVFRCFDGYDVGIPLEPSLLEGTILAYEMNGVPLPADHGFPLRAVVPGLYGMMNAKWITEIELVDTVYEGFWQRRGWDNNAEYQTHSTIVLPGEALTNRFGELSSRIFLGGKVQIAGIAFAGARGISKVEVSTDGGESWEAARLKDPLSANTWVLWAIDWNPTAEGSYQIIVRATDNTGKVQPTELQKPFPSGSTGYHKADVMVEA
ncbi:MAG: sulfite oxidase [Nitrososphaerales archaeon]